MQAPTNLLWSAYPELKYWVSIGGFFFTLFKGYYWIKDVRDKDLKQLHESVSSLNAELKSQTTSFVSAVATNTKELTELRSDLRTFYAPVRAKGARARRKKS
jgi:hypothetical protein